MKARKMRVLSTEYALMKHFSNSFKCRKSLLEYFCKLYLLSKIENNRPIKPEPEPEYLLDNENGIHQIPWN